MRGGKAALPQANKDTPENSNAPDLPKKIVPLYQNYDLLLAFRSRHKATAWLDDGSITLMAGPAISQHGSIHLIPVFTAILCACRQGAAKSPSL